MEEVEEVQFSSDEPKKTFKIGKLLCELVQTKLVEFLKADKANFAWKHHDIIDIDPLIMMHKLVVDLKAKPVKKK